jgi:hypothetical protein
MNSTFTAVTETIWQRAQRVLSAAREMEINTNWYAFWQQPRTPDEKYRYGYWLTYYLYKDMCHGAILKGDTELKRILDIAYYSGDWKQFLKSYRIKGDNAR